MKKDPEDRCRREVNGARQAMHTQIFGSTNSVNRPYEIGALLERG